jgi:prepilin-type N-terminal cleavage/methylation domain-containing protein
MGMLQRNNNRRGFTIVELSVVMVVLGILAGIVIVSVGSWRTSAARKEVQSDLNGVVAGMNSARNFNNGYPSSLPGSFTASPNVQLTYVSGDAGGYCIDGKSKLTASATYFIDTIRTGGQPRYGTCALGEMSVGFVLINTTVPSFSKDFDSRGCAIRDGRPFCWSGSGNLYGERGNGTKSYVYAPTDVLTSGALSGKTVTAIETGLESTCAIADGEVYCWGRNYNGIVGFCIAMQGVGESTVPVSYNTCEPTNPLVGKTVTAISKKDVHVCAIAEGKLFCWGNNTYNQLGRPNGGLPFTLGALAGKTVTSVSVGYEMTCAVADGAAYCWGRNLQGALGVGDLVNRATPTLVGGALTGKTVTRISAGVGHNACAVADGAAYCWGEGTGGRIGDGASVDRTSPVAVSTAGVLNGKTVTDIAVGSGHVCVLASSNVYCWGNNNAGQFGNGTTTNSSLPVATDMTGILNGKTVTKISAGIYVSCALADSDSYCWGKGPLYSGGPTNNLSPVHLY